MPHRNRSRFYSSDAADRRCFARQHLDQNEDLVTLTSFPRLGVEGQFTEPFHDPAKAISGRSLFLPEEITNPHPRYMLVTSFILASA